jgi:hypothetical protein
MRNGSSNGRRTSFPGVLQMDRSALRARFVATLLLLAATSLAGCSGSSGGSNTASAAQDGGNQTPPTQQPPAEDPPGEDPAGEDPPAEDPGDDPLEPSVNLAAAEPVVPAGASVLLSWSSENASGCNASGGWSGAKGLQGSTTVGPLSQSTTFTLTCSGAGGNAVDMLSVSVHGVVSLGWEPPTENIDGSPLHDLAGYRIYYGQFSGSYTDELAVSNADATQYEVALPSGSYYFAMTALDVEGNESGYSNEVVKVVN